MHNRLFKFRLKYLHFRFDNELIYLTEALSDSGFPVLDQNLGEGILKRNAYTVTTVLDFYYDKCNVRNVYVHENCTLSLFRSMQ